jgi:hypothetical protein
MTRPLVSRSAAIKHLRRGDEQSAAAVRAFNPYPVRVRNLGVAARRSCNRFTERSPLRFESPSASRVIAPARPHRGAPPFDLPPPCLRPPLTVWDWSSGPDAHSGRALARSWERRARRCDLVYLQADRPVSATQRRTRAIRPVAPRLRSSSLFGPRSGSHKPNAVSSGGGVSQASLPRLRRRAAAKNRSDAYVMQQPATPTRPSGCACTPTS